MKLEWDFTAQSYLDQLPAEERSKVLRAVDRLPAALEREEEPSRLHKLTGSDDTLYSLNVGSDLRVLLQQAGDAMTVVDVVRRSQVEGLRRLASSRPGRVR